MRALSKITTTLRFTAEVLVNKTIKKMTKKKINLLKYDFYSYLIVIQISCQSILIFKNFSKNFSRHIFNIVSAICY